MANEMKESKYTFCVPVKLREKGRIAIDLNENSLILWNGIEYMHQNKSVVLIMNEWAKVYIRQYILGGHLTSCGCI